jgi:phage gp46-like protein
VNCEEEMREKNDMGEGGCMCVVGERKKERQGVHGWWGKKKRNGEWGLRVWWEKRGSGKKKRRKKFEKKKTKLVLFVCSLCLVQSVEL